MRAVRITVLFTLGCGSGETARPDESGLPPIRPGDTAPAAPTGSAALERIPVGSGWQTPGPTGSAPYSPWTTPTTTAETGGSGGVSTGGSATGGSYGGSFGYCNLNCPSGQYCVDCLSTCYGSGGSGGSGSGGSGGSGAYLCDLPTCMDIGTVC